MSEHCAKFHLMAMAFAVLIGLAAGCGDRAPGKSEGCVKNPTLCYNPVSGHAPTARVIVDRVFGIAPLGVSFSGQCFDTGGDCGTFAWNFGDGTATDTKQITQHTYTTAGIYTATLVVKDLAGTAGVSRIRIEAAAQGAMPAGMEGVLRNILNARWTPELRSAGLYPSVPVAGKPTAVVADIGNDPTLTMDRTTEATLYYSLSGGSDWTAVAMATQTDNTWKATIPAQTANTNVLYALKAKDTAGNLYIEAVCPTTAVTVASAGYLAEDCAAGGAVADCAAQAPRGCMFPMAADPAPVDDPIESFSSDFDIWEMRVGYDNQNIYIDQAVQGSVSTGTASPVNIHMYQTWLINPDKPAAGTAMSDLAAQSGTLTHGPLLTVTGGLVKPCAYTEQQGGVSVQNETAIACAASGRHLVLTLNRLAYGANSSGLLKFFTIDSALTSVSMSSGSYYDYTRTTTVRIGPARSFTVR